MKGRLKIPGLYFLIFLCCGNMWLYWSRLPRAAANLLHPTETIRPKSLSDLYPRWYGTRELLLHHRNPYGIEVSNEIQVAFYGKVLDSSIPNEPRDQQRFAYPLYVVLLMAPTVYADFHTVRVIFTGVLRAAVVLSIFFWMRAFRLRLSMAALAALTALTLSSIPVMQGIDILQLGLLVSCFIAGASLLLIKGNLFPAGTVLALATIKPQMCVLPILWFALWAFSDWQRRRALVAGFASTLATLLLISEILLPGWLLHYPEALRAYAEYTRATSPIQSLFPGLLSWLIAVSIIFAASFFCWRARHEPATSTAFAIALSFALTLTVIILPTTLASFNHVLILPVVFLVLLRWKDLWSANFLSRFACIIFLSLGSLPWVLALIPDFAPGSMTNSWFVWSAPLFSSLALPFAGLGFVIMLSRNEQARETRGSIHNGADQS